MDNRTEILARFSCIPMRNRDDIETYRHNHDPIPRRYIEEFNEHIQNRRDVEMGPEKVRPPPDKQLVWPVRDTERARNFQKNKDQLKRKANKVHDHDNLKQCDSNRKKAERRARDKEAERARKELTKASVTPLPDGETPCREDPQVSVPSSDEEETVVEPPSARVREESMEDSDSPEGTTI